jgi:hypothetical protein
MGEGIEPFPISHLPFPISHFPSRQGPQTAFVAILILVSSLLQ